MTYDGTRLTPRQAAGFVLMHLGLAAYCAAWVAGFMWVLS